MIPEDVLAFFDLKQGRRPKAILNVLVGKMTVSALFWGLEYDILEYLNFWKTVDTTSFLENVDRAVEGGFLAKKDELIYLTEAGQQKQFSCTTPTPFIKKVRLDEAIDLLLLANQVISEFSFKNNRYIPVSDNLRINVILKNWFKQLKSRNHHTTDIVQKYTQGLDELLSQLQQHDADILLSYLPNHVDPGWTIDQLAQAFGISKFQMELKIRLIFSKIISDAVLTKTAPFVDLLNSTIKENVMPDSTYQTWQLIRQGKTVDEVARLKHVKTNTVKEHILMAAILDSNFPFDKFVRFNFEIGKHPTEVDFRSIQSQIADITFFDFRLIQIRKIKEQQNNNDNR
ncbi:helix-turn-helix domain-containing protein [Pediococcus pentosaceus]|uniref:helix-turn-helix domain-containing protein n=1 Tax=Pediococcus pentosaceus TaxID=1255 RepID=UPI004039D3AF